MKSFTILHTILSSRQPHNRPSFWKRVLNFFRGITHLQLYHWKLSVAVDTLRGVTIGNVFIAQHGTAWEITNIGNHHEPPYIDVRYIDIQSWKPTAYSAIQGPAVIVARPQKKRA